MVIKFGKPNSLIGGKATGDTTVPIGTIINTRLPAPSVPSSLTNPLLQDTSVYRSLRNLQQVSVAPISFGTVATTSSDGKPATFTQGGLDANLVRVAPNGQSASLGLAYEWVAGGGETAVGHGLNRIPIGYWVVRNSVGAMIYDGTSAWTNSTIFLNTTHSNSDIILMIF